ncbi:SsgA family sporulation/cell division regulator [Marmoricola sp. RAF53]|uniref:SsgA family sporulation/cell division regulator n=1 Tax=Marmoricola sp. RAF53 TaxID=3233059 RepID=UPI003F970D37
MQKEITAQSIITEAMRMEFVDAEGQSTPLDAEFEFDPADPFAVTILFKGEPVPVRWTFARELLIEGFYEPTGDGDVHVWPCLSASGRAVVILELISPSGEVLIQVSSRELSTFIHRMVAMVPPGTESDLLDLDATVAALFAA